MCAIMNGIGYHGIFRASGATFLVFADYCRAVHPPRRALAAAEHLHLHARFDRRRRRWPDASAGRDGERLRVIPQLDVIRPADPEETAGAFVAAAQRIDGPTLLALTRQAVPMLNEIDVKAAPRRRARAAATSRNARAASSISSCCRAAANCSTR